MSIASLPSKNRSVESVTALEVALARVISDCRKEWSLQIQVAQAETRAALVELNSVRKELERVLDEFDARVAVAVGPQGLQGPPGPAGLDGAPGRDGQPGRDGLSGVQGSQGERGKDGRDGIDGIHGKDGLGFEDLEETVEDGGRVLIRRYRRGDQVKEFRHVTATTIYRGAWKEGIYQHGDAVTYAGSTFTAMKDTQAKPETNHDWQCSSKRGQHGRDGKDGERGPQGPQGSAGRDLTQLGADGRKW